MYSLSSLLGNVCDCREDILLKLSSLQMTQRIGTPGHMWKVILSRWGLLVFLN